LGNTSVYKLFDQPTFRGDFLKPFFQVNSSFDFGTTLVPYRGKNFYVGYLHTSYFNLLRVPGEEVLKAYQEFYLMRLLPMFSSQDILI